MHSMLAGVTLVLIVAAILKPRLLETPHFLPLFTTLDSGMYIVISTSNYSIYLMLLSSAWSVL